MPDTHKPKIKPPRVGQTFAGRRGNYHILKTGTDTLTVLYVDGPWVDRKVQMSLITHRKIQDNNLAWHNISVMREKENTEDTLEAWWNKHSKLYQLHWHEGISGVELLTKLETEYPDLATEIQDE